MKVFKILFFLLLSACCFAGDLFELCIIKKSGGSSPLSSSVEAVLKYLASSTSIDPPQEAVYLEVGQGIFDYPFLCVTGKGSLPDFTRKETALLAKHLSSGGFLFIDETESYGLDDFYRSVKDFSSGIFPSAALEKIPEDDVIFRSFYLQPKAAGRNSVSPSLYGVRIDGRWVIVYSRNDIFGAWARDESGRFIYSCYPGGEAQRLEAVKITVNIVMYSLTGTYKKDIIHRDFIERKLKSW
ncbi:MAG: DUF4159 domain-containing protein [Candidatus Omnitrophota bacterium]|nr:DUF4159 domain-containing protein [bacterium]MBU4123041.1 DUF4159 domain-containing protein [bacterium]